MSIKSNFLTIEQNTSPEIKKASEILHSKDITGIKYYVLMLTITLCFIALLSFCIIFSN